MFGIIGAMDSEVEHLVGRMVAVSAKTVAGRTVYTGLLAGKPVAVIKSGIGKVAAAGTAQLLIDCFEADVLINTGVAGGLDSRLAVKDLVVGVEAVQHDFDLTAFGHAPGFIAGEDDSRATVFYADNTLAQAAITAAAAVLPAGSKAIPGRIASGDVFVADGAVKQHIIRQFGAAAVEMEGAAIAQTAAANGVPFVILRVISDLAEHQANVSFDEMEIYAGQLAEDITVAMLERL